MKKIEEIAEHIEEELDDAEHYIKDALKYKEEDKTLANTFCTLSKEEMRHVTMLHLVVVDIIDKYTESGKTIPESMQAVYNYLHERHIKKSNQIKMYQNQFEEV